MVNVCFFPTLFVYQDHINIIIQEYLHVLSAENLSTIVKLTSSANCIAENHDYKKKKLCVKINYNYFVSLIS